MGPNGHPMPPPGRGPPSGRFYPGEVRPRSPAGPGYGGQRPYPNGPGPVPGPMPHSQFPVPRSMSPGPRSMSPGPGPRSMSPGPHMRPGPRSMSPGPGPYPAPGSMSPGPGPYPAPRSMSPGPYGPQGMPQPGMPINQRQRSNSAGNISPPNVGAGAPPRSSPLAATQPPAPAPTGDLPAIPSSVSGSPPPPGSSPIGRKPIAQNF